MICIMWRGMGGNAYDDTSIFFPMSASLSTAFDPSEFVVV